MLFRPDADDLKLVGLYTGTVLYGIGVAMLVPLAVALALGERNEALAFVIGASLAIGVGALARMTLRTRATLTGAQGLATVGLVWTVVPVFAAVPLLLSGHYASYLDAYFESVSGFATVGLTLANDLDHMARSVNVWRHLLHALGGQAIVVVVLTILSSIGGTTSALSGGGDGKDRILPNVVSSTAFILRVLVAYAAIGLPLLWLVTIRAGLDPATALFHAFTLFVSAFDTAGFAPTSASAAFYRSALVEAVLIVVMVAGAFSFAIHYQLWQGRRRELTRSLETRTLAISLLAIMTLLSVGLVRAGTFTDGGDLLRHGFFQTLSAHTTTGLSTVPGALLVSDWGVLAPAMIVTAMALGGMAGSTAGGIKAIRVGLLVRGILANVRRALSPEDAVLVETYHAGSRQILREGQVKAAMTLFVLFLVLYLAGGLLGLLYGYDPRLALFESTAAGATGGLSVGVVRPDLEWPLKAFYLLQMLLGRLEFIAVFALAGYVAASLRGRV